MNLSAYRIYIMACCLLCITTAAQAQQSRRLIAGGNKLYEAGKFKEAALLYSQALKADTAYQAKGAYNLGNALYQQKQPEAARKAYEAAAKKITDKQEHAGSDYNVGNTYMQEKKWEDAIEAYKKTLRANPQDADAKYNLSYAKSMLKKEGGGGKSKDKKKDKEQQDEQKKEQEQPKDEKKEQQENQDKPQPKDGQDKNDQQQPQPQPSKLSEKQAEQLLNALQQEEKKLQDKNKKTHGVPVKVEKDW